MKRTCLVALGLLLLALVSALILAAVFVRRSGLSTRPEPSAAEARLARIVRGLAIAPEARAARNPVVPSPDALAEGRAHFADHCAGCHANDGSGNTELGRRLYPRAPDMRLPATQRLTDGELFFIIENGVRLTGMPGWGGEVPPEASWKLVHFIRHLPSIAPEEVTEMERLNPKSPREWQEMQEDERFLQGDQGDSVERTAPSRHEH